ncbi:amidohydrolase family protein [Streptomyces lydicamycinicus]|uniref:Putative chlorohydrolase n=1 Tax=Streptomyces lydicamycinicus TaxID=1546107 RepID=A0A0P4R3J5_9ACTN|nr:amidohydrolase family protein [Streptomyces lydicamycinicus]USA02133.1 amidohydrolase family protein [Streptomyces lydicamycinicus]GAO07070.1 putative chlorohydrolase [Streptomyces lydicamycinicus]
MGIERHHSPRLLLRGGLVIDTAPHPVVHPHTDVLVEEGRIAAVGRGLPFDEADTGLEVIDARELIVLPGFVDTHRHVWQAVLRSAAVDESLDSYLGRILGDLSGRFTPADVYTGNLLGALECLDTGVTTVQDFSHVQYTPEHSAAAVEALEEAGIRAVFGYGYPVFDDTARRADWVRQVRTRYFPSGEALLTMALAPVGPSFAPPETVREDWLLARELGLPIAVHVTAGPVAMRPIAALQEQGLLTAGTLYVHGNSLPDSELRLIAESGGAVAITPAIEASMRFGAPMAGRLRRAGIPTGLGADAVTSAPGDMFSQMRAALMSSHFDGDGDGEADAPTVKAADVLRMATAEGAEALGLADEVGSLGIGKRADLVLLRADALNLAPVAHDPIGAVVTAAHPGNIDTVLVDGRPVKRNGQLLYGELGNVLTTAHRAAERLVTTG